MRRFAHRCGVLGVLVALFMVVSSLPASVAQKATPQATPEAAQLPDGVSVQVLS